MEPYDPYPWLEGEIISKLAGRVVVKCHAVDGNGFVAKKVSPIGNHLESQAYILKYAREVAGVKTPKLHCLYVQENKTVMVTDYDSGVRLDAVWPTMDHANRTLLRKDLQEQIRRMRQCVKSSIGLVNENGDLDPAATFPDPSRPSFSTSLTAFATEADLDAHKVSELRKRHPIAVADLQNRIKKLSNNYTEKVVLTHGDLNPRNIQVKRVVEATSGRLVWRISNILDWERGGFFPEYMEYALAKICLGHERD
jgi:Phosphotransferase enzyme family